MLQTLVAPASFRFSNRISLRSFTVRAFTSSTDYEDQSRGGLPRFFSETLPPSKGNVIRVKGDEFWHMTKVLRLSTNARVQLFNGKGGLVEGCIQNIDRTGLDFVALTDPKLVPPQNSQLHVFSGFGTLKGGRADWLVEKCTVCFNSILKFYLIAQSELSLVATAEATPVLNALSLGKETSGLLIIGPEGDFTEKEVNMMMEAGAKAVSLGPHRLRVETAAIALLSTVMLWSDSQQTSVS
ncbi:uncharacterized protein LOC127096627 isoform X2 [Lathyrus oleraceus]|uniref:uncharacterized protein LOC127096627 isoform X2 n=1 Tax=Pisum sativum TaxID=3888 RepID=UPI0021D0E327|nr:uncharacterized protein LOC127096627 isoform X2 [Pisum sativum]